MKKITNYFKTMALLFAMSFSNTNNAQCVLSAGFNYTVSNNGLVNFESTSTGTVMGTLYVWDFGNGFNNSTANSGSASHAFPINGNYTVGMIANNSTVTPGCIDTLYQVISVNTVTCTINAMFLNSQGASGLVNFTNLTYGADPGVTYLWDFGDGTTGSTTSPAHTYSANGVYTVSLNADNNYSYTCSSAMTTTIFVSSYCTYTPSFSVNYGLNGIVTLNSNSSWFLFDTWDFGDGTPVQWPAPGSTPMVHTYQNGSYMVSLTVTNATFAPSCSLTYTQMINVTSYACNLNANFTHAAVPSPTAAYAVSFDGSSTTGVNGNTQYFWDFGDGNTYGPNNFSYAAWHVFSSAGPYNVKLKVSDMTDPTCVDSVIMSVNATGTCVADASFILYPSGTPQEWIVSPNYPYNVTAASWNWGDGNTGNSLYDSHTYATAGTYTLCLTVTITCGAVDTECSSYYVYKTGETNEMIGVTVIEPGTTTGIKNVSAKDVAFTVYPNPGNGLINISSNTTGSAKIMIYDLLGHVIYNESSELSNTTSKQIQLNDVSNGIYFVKVISGDKTHTQKIVISK